MRRPLGAHPIARVDETITCCASLAGGRVVKYSTAVHLRAFLQS
jgi:hypothetical protein